MPQISRRKPTIEIAKKMLWRNAKFFNREARKTMLSLVNSGKIEEFLTLLTLASMRGRIVLPVLYS
jgi:hypothetical protein